MGTKTRRIRKRGGEGNNGTFSGVNPAAYVRAKESLPQKTTISTGVTPSKEAVPVTGPFSGVNPYSIKRNAPGPGRYRVPFTESSRSGKSLENILGVSRPGVRTTKNNSDVNTRNSVKQSRYPGLGNYYKSTQPIYSRIRRGALVPMNNSSSIKPMANVNQVTAPSEQTLINLPESDSELTIGVHNDNSNSIKSMVGKRINMAKVNKRETAPINRFLKITARKKNMPTKQTVTPPSKLKNSHKKPSNNVKVIKLAANRIKNLKYSTLKTAEIIPGENGTNSGNSTNSGNNANRLSRLSSASTINTPNSRRSSAIGIIDNGNNENTYNSRSSRRSSVSSVSSAISVIGQNNSRRRLEQTPMLTRRIRS